MSRLILLLFLTAFVAAQIPDGCVDCGLPDHPNCQVSCDLVRFPISLHKRVVMVVMMMVVEMRMAINDHDNTKVRLCSPKWIIF